MDGILFCGIILFFFYNFVLYLLPTLCAISVVVATAKVRIFKQITTKRYEWDSIDCCCCYRKGTNFQANHNGMGRRILVQRLLLLPQRYEFSSKSQHVLCGL